MSDLRTPLPTTKRIRRYLRLWAIKIEFSRGTQSCSRDYALRTLQCILFILKLVPKEGFEPSRITRSKRGSSASFLLSTSASKLVGLKGVAPSRIIGFKPSRSAISGYPQAHLKLFVSTQVHELIYVVYVYTSMSFFLLFHRAKNTCTIPHFLSFIDC